jgi:hypothetical protein
VKSRILTREELYQMVWSKPATKLANELGISDVAITKLCRRHNIPKPWPGYWRILEAGHTRKIPSLPAHGHRNLTRLKSGLTSHKLISLNFQLYCRRFWK